MPERYRGRKLHAHNPQVTLMRTTPEENERIGRWIGERLNRMDGPVRFFLPEGGVSALDAPGQPFHDPDADAALFRALEQTVRQTSNRQLIRAQAPHQRSRIRRRGRRGVPRAASGAPARAGGLAR